MATTTGYRSPQPGSRPRPAPPRDGLPSSRGWGGAMPYLATGLLFGVLLAVLHDPSVAATAGNDAATYTHMAQHPGVTVAQAPFAYRVGVPWLLGWLHIPGGLLFVTWVSVTAAGGLFHGYLRAHVSPRSAWLGLALLAGTGGLVVALFDPYLIDGAAVLVTVAALRAAQDRRWLVALVALAAGAVVRESLLFVAVPVAWFAFTEGQRRAAAWLVGVPVAVTVGLHLLIRPLPGGPGLDMGTVRDTLAHATQGGWTLPGAILVAWLTSVGFSAIAAVDGFHSAPRLWRLSTVIAVPLVLSCLVATNWYRVLSFAAPAVIPLAMVAVDRHPALARRLVTGATMSVLLTVVYR